MQLISNSKTVGSNTVQILKGFHSQSLPTRAKRRKICFYDAYYLKKAFDFMGDDIVELSTENETLKNRIGFYDETWLKESKAKLLKQNDDEKRTFLIMSRMEKHMKKRY